MWSARITFIILFTWKMDRNVVLFPPRNISTLRKFINIPPGVVCIVLIEIRRFVNRKMWRKTELGPVTADSVLVSWKNNVRKFRCRYIFLTFYASEKMNKWINCSPVKLITNSRGRWLPAIVPPQIHPRHVFFSNKRNYLEGVSIRIILLYKFENNNFKQDKINYFENVLLCLR